MVDMDGYSTINTEEDGIYLTVFPPRGKGKRVELDSVKKELDKEVYKDKDIAMEDVERAVKEATGQPVLIIRENIEVKDGQVFVNITSDEMYAQITIVPPQGGGKEVTEDVVKNALTENGIVFGIQEDVIKKLVARGLEAKDDPTILLEEIQDVRQDRISLF